MVVHDKIRPLVHRLISDLKHDPHAILGLHPVPNGEKVVRIYRPGAPFVSFELFGQIVQATKVDDAGLFEYPVPSHTTHFDYRIYYPNGQLSYDPYAFLPTFEGMDQYLFAQGRHYELYKKMGARIAIHQGVWGVQFAVWAPSAQSVAIVHDANCFDGRIHPMRSLGFSGVWELFVPGMGVGEKYKFEIRTQDGKLLIKADPYATSFEMRPKTASVVQDVLSYDWTDQSWIEKRAHTGHTMPLNIYEVHLGSWKKEHGKFINYRDLAHELTRYVKEMGFTHVELMPLAEHPLDESWGYQVTGFFAPTSRFGTPQDFQYFVDYLHKNEIGIIIDWVPGHFPLDDGALARFDGTALYEHEDPRQGLHPHWSTAIFNFGRNEVTNFLIASALHWLDYFHIDGLRVDAVASMLYLDYGRNEGEWIPNRYGGKENLEAIEFLKHVNSVVHGRFPGVLTIAEESTSFAKITHSLAHGGIGFDYKWNMGWMNDTLRYFSKDPVYRAHHHSDLTFGLLYAFSEKFISVLSHDEVVHGKKSLLSKMPGDVWQQFANLRLLYAYMMTMPGKKLFFMSGEIGQWNEWNATSEVEWGLLHYPIHSGLQRMVKEMNYLYLEQRALWSDDCSFHGFEWVHFTDTHNSVLAFKRKCPQTGAQLLVVLNFTPQYHGEYVMPCSGVSHLEELFNSDESVYGGSGKVKEAISVHHGHVKLSLAPLACAIYRCQALDLEILQKGV